MFCLFTEIVRCVFFLRWFSFGIIPAGNKMSLSLKNGSTSIDLVPGLSLGRLMLNIGTNLVSRNHAKIGGTLKRLNIVCTHGSGLTIVDEEKTVTLTKNQKSTLSFGMRIAFGPVVKSSKWFDVVRPATTTTTKKAIKRKSNDPDSKSLCGAKKTKLFGSDSDDNDETNNDVKRFGPRKKVVKKSAGRAKQASVVSDGDENNSDDEKGGRKGKGKQKNDGLERKAKTNVKSSTVLTNNEGYKTRLSCLRGVSCNDIRNAHRVAFAHPGEPDFVANRPWKPKSNALPCPYGGTCYRNGYQHCTDFKH